MKRSNSNICFLILIVYTILGGIYLNNSYHKSQDTFNVASFTISVIVYFAIFGFLLGLENLIAKLAQEKMIKLNVFKITVFIILFFVVVSYILAYLALIPNELLKYNNIYTLILQSVLLGYSLASIDN